MKLLSLIILLFLADITHCQNYLINTQKLSIEDGLSNRFAYSVLKDRDGFIWIGTSFGLNKYDGYSFKSYTSAHSSITDKHIKKLLQDDQGKIWLCNIVWSHPKSIFKRIDIFDPSTEEIIPFDSIVHNFAELKKENITALYASSNQEIYLGTITGQLYLYANQKISLVPYNFSNSQIDKIIVSKKSIGVKTGNQLLEIDHKGTLLSKQKLAPAAGLMGVDSSGQIWWWEKIDSQIQLKHLNQAQELVSYSHPSLELIAKPIREFKRYGALQITPKDNNIWCETNTHLNILHPQKGLLYSFDKKDLEPSLGYNGFPVPFPQIYIDNQNLAWICTTAGVQKVILQPKIFKTYLPKHSTRRILSLNDSSLLVASYFGLKKLQGYNTNSVETKNSTIAGQGMDMLKDSLNACIWISSGDDILAQYFPSEQRFEYDTIPPLHLKNKNTALKNYAISLFCLEQRGNTLWIGTTEGLFSYNIKERTFSLFEQYNDFLALKGATIYDLKHTTEGLWIASAKGLFLLDYKQGIIEKWSSDAKTKLPFNVILHIHKAPDGLLWLATKGGGIIKLDRKNNSYQQFTTREGLAHDITYGIYEDDFGYLWISSNYGLMRFDKKTHIINTYLPKDGIPHEEFNRVSHHQAADGTLFFGGLNGIVQFHPKDFIDNSSQTEQLQITNYQQFDGSSGALVDRTTELLNKQKITLAPNDKFFTLSFALLDFKNPKSNKYAYQIENYDSDWVFTNTPKIRINGLPAGQYTLSIKAQGSNGQWTQNPIKTDIQVLLPFYKTWWFIVSMILFLVLSLLSYARWRVRTLQQRQEELHLEVKRRTLQIEEDKKIIEQQAQKLQALDDVKSRFFANISHELRTPLTLILGPMSTITKKDYEENIQKIKKIVQTTQRNGQQLQQLIEEILELSKLEANKMDLKTEPTLLYPFLKQLCSPFETQAEILKISFELFYQLDPDLCVVLDRTKFEKIVNNLLSNALKYTSAKGSITIEVSQKDKQLYLQVMDSGQGIHANDLPYIFDRYYQSKQPHAPIQGGTGIGLALAKELTQFLGGSLQAKSDLGKGTTFTLSLPLAISEEDASNTISIEEAIETPFVPSLPKDQAIKILVVEDNLDMQQYISDILKPYYAIEYAVNGALALEYIQTTSTPPQLIISDWMMPIMDGMQLLHNLKSSTDHAKIPVIMLTARAEQHNKLQALSLGVDDYLVKPFSAAELLVRIQNLLKRSTQQQAFLKENTAHEEPLVSVDGKWLQELKTIVEKELQTGRLNIGFIAAELNLSERQLHRRVKSLTGLTPNKYIREIKLLIAKKALEQQQFLTVSEVAHHIGFTNVNHFSKLYAERFGKKPMDYIK
ncbi:MAG: response regulator [Aureispira sp.]|nr:response regulator [Aureispira sp.]